MSTVTRKRKRKDPVTHVLTKELFVSVSKMKVTELNKWTPVLQSEKTPMLCFEGYVSRINGQKRRYTAYKTQPLDVRLGSYLFRQVNGETCSLVGDLYDPSNSIPLSVKSKFKNGIPKKWQTIAAFWDNMQKHSFCRKQLRSFSSRFAWVESMKSSGLLRVSSRGRIIIPSPKYLKGKNVDQGEIETAHLINSQLNMIRTNLDVTAIHKTDDMGSTPRQSVENNCSTVNENKLCHCTNYENPTKNTPSKSNFSHKISEHGHVKAVENSRNSMKDTRRSSINQRKLLTCKRKLIVAEVQSKMCRSSKTSKNAYEKITNKYHYRCLPHRRKYLLRSTSATRLLQKNNQFKKDPIVTSVIMRGRNRVVTTQRKQPLQTKMKLNVLNKKNKLIWCQGKNNSFSCRKQNQEGNFSKEAGLFNKYAVQNSKLESELCSKEYRNETTVIAEKNKQCEALLKLPYKDPYLVGKDIHSKSVLKNCTNRLRKSKQRVCCQDSGDTERTKKKSEMSPSPKASSTGFKTLQGTFEDSDPVFTHRKTSGSVEPLLSKRHEEINMQSIPAGDQDLLGRKVPPQKISEDISRRDRFSGRRMTSPFRNSKRNQSRLVSDERHTENRKSAARNQLNEKGPYKVLDRSRKKSLSASKSVTVTSAMKIKVKALEDTKEAETTQGKMLNSASKRKICKEDSKQSRISDVQSSEPCLHTKDTSETSPRKSEKTEPNLSLGPVLTDRKSTGYVEPLLSKRFEEINMESIATEDQDFLGRKMTPQKRSEDISRRDRFSGKSVTSPFNSSKCIQSRLVSNERQTENRRSASGNHPNEKELHKVPERSRKKSLLSSKSSVAVTSSMKVKAQPLEDAKEPVTTQGKMLNSTSKRKTCKEASKQSRISDVQASEPCIPAKDTSESSPRKLGKMEPNLSLDDIDDILTTGAPRTLKQRKKLRKTIDSYAKSQTTCTDLFSDPDYNHLIGDNDPCSSQEWDKDYAEAIEKLVNGKLSDQISLGSTSPAQYLQDFVCDDNQSVRSASPFERTPCDEEFKLRYEHRVLKERNEHTRRKSWNMDVLSSFAHRETDASTEADAAYKALIQGKPVPQKLFDLKCKKTSNSSDDSSSECSDEL